MAQILTYETSMTKGYEGWNDIKIILANTTYEPGVMQCFFSLGVLQSSWSSNGKPDSGSIHNEK